MNRTRLKSIALVSLVSAWLLASVAPGVLGLVTAGSRTLLAAAGSSTEMTAVTLALLRGELCGFGPAADSHSTDPSTPRPPAETNPAKIVLSLVENQTELIVSSRRDTPPGSGLLQAALNPEAPPGPPPKVI